MNKPTMRVNGEKMITIRIKFHLGLDEMIACMHTYCSIHLSRDETNHDFMPPYNACEARERLAKDYPSKKSVEERVRMHYSDNGNANGSETFDIPFSWNPGVLEAFIQHIKKLGFDFGKGKASRDEWNVNSDELLLREGE